MGPRPRTPPAAGRGANPCGYSHADIAVNRAITRYPLMLVRHLSYFITLAKERHFARAADACNIAQPTLSAAIRKLEDDLGARLVVRGQRFVGLTAEGEKLLVWGR